MLGDPAEWRSWFHTPIRFQWGNEHVKIFMGTMSDSVYNIPWTMDFRCNCVDDVFT